MRTQTESPAVATIRAALECGRDHCGCRSGPTTHCPSHRPDRNPSLSLASSRDGRPLVKCFGKCTQDEVIAALKHLGVWPEHHEPVAVNGQHRANGRAKTNGHRPAPAPVDDGPLDGGTSTTPRLRPGEWLAIVYEYRDTAGQLIAEKARIERPGDKPDDKPKKRFLWRLPGVGRWSGLHADEPFGIAMEHLPLYGAHLVAAAPVDQPIVFCEGEKAADACVEHGMVAVSFAGGASTKDWGTSLEVLRGRKVIIWPDNDEGGRIYAAAVAAALQPLAAKVSMVMVPGGPKDDAVEYFAKGGTVEGLVQYVPPTETVVDYLAYDSVRVRVPTASGVVAFTFTEMEQSARELNAELEVRLEGPGQAQEPYPQRLNLLSSSQRDALRRDLESVYGKDKDGTGYRWPLTVNTAIARARTAYLDQDRAELLDDIEDDEEEVTYLVDPIIPTGAPVILFGDGESGKSYFTIRCCIAVAGGPPMPGMRTIHGPVLYIDYEADRKAFRRRVNRLLAGSDHPDPDSLRLPIHYWNARGISVPGQIESIRRKVVKEGIVLVVIDAAGDACGGKPEEAETALQLFNALKRLPEGVAVLIIAHITKNDTRTGTDRPYGSTFFHNRARRTWLVQADKREASDVKLVSLYCKKANDDSRPRPMGFKLTFVSKAGPVRLERSDLALIPEITEGTGNGNRNLKARIYALLLREGFMTVASIAEELGAKPASVGATLRDERDLFVSQPGSTTLGGRGNQAVWGVRTSREEVP